MKKFFSSFTRLIAAVLVAGAIFFPVKSFAAEMNSADIEAFREALANDSDALDRVFRQQVFLVAMPFIGDLDFLGMVDGDTFKATGEFAFWTYNEDGTSTDKIIPFYLVQNQNVMTVYFKADKQWEKFTTPSFYGAVMELVTKPSAKEIESLIQNETKEVVVLQEDDSRRVLLVKLDGNKIADSLKLLSDQNPSEDTAAVSANMQNTATNYIDSALRNGEMWYMWTIDKRDWHTVTMQFNFSGFLQALGRAALNDPKQIWPDEIRQKLETIAFYSELRAYTMYPSDPAVKKNFDIPKNVLKAKEISGLPTTK